MLLLPNWVVAIAWADAWAWGSEPAAVALLTWLVSHASTWKICMDSGEP